MLCPVLAQHPAREEPHPSNVAAARVNVEGLTKRYTTGATELVALDAVDLAVDAGAFVAIVGPSGSGKSTLLHLLGAMDDADSGTIRVDAEEVSRLSSSAEVGYRRRIGFVFQRFHLLPALTVLDNVAAPLLPYRTEFDKLKRARELLGAVGLAGREKAMPSELSGGQQQRVALARALMNDPVLLLADEPTGNLDSQTGGEIMDLLVDLHKRQPMTVLVATHDQVIASRCDRIVRLFDGRIVDDVTVNPAASEHVLERISRIEG
jgi:putative ABC transport system ATP-binding protein